MTYQWDFSPIWRNWSLLLEGLANTVWLSAWSIALGLVIGLALALMRLAKTRAISIVATAIIEFYRNTPPLVHFRQYLEAAPRADPPR